MSENKELFEKMPVPKALTKLAIPTIISQIVILIYNLADTYFVGRTNDPYMVAAVSFSYVLFFAMNALSNLFGIGGGSLFSRLLGAGKPDDARRVCSFSFYAAIIIGLVSGVLCMVFMDPLLNIMGASENTIGYGRQYLMYTVVLGAVPTTVGLTMSHLLRSEGYSRYSGLGLTMGSILNIALDPLFMFVIMPDGMEVAGAAIATLISNTVVFVYYLYVFIHLKKRNAILSVNPRYMRISWSYFGSILAVGFPSALSSLLASTSNMVCNNLASNYGDIPLAALGIVKKLDMLPTKVGMGLCQGMLPLVAYNYAAKNYRRMREAANTARIVGICFAAVCIFCFELFPGSILRTFIKDPETISLGIVFLRITVLATPFTIINFQMCYTFQAIGKGPQSLLLSACRQGLLNIPLLFLMRHLFGLYGIVCTQLIADSLTIIISFIFYSRLQKQLSKEVFL